MAEAQDTLNVSDLKENFLECPICMEHFDQAERRPRLLVNCLHAFCTQCLEQLLKKEGRGHVTCPNCRQVQEVKGTAQSLPVDQVRNKLVDYVQFKKGKNIPCTGCPDGSNAVVRCHECKSYMCTPCKEAHHRNMVTRKHTCLSLEDALIEPIKNFMSHFCKDHPDHKIEFYCGQCSSLCCVSCSIWKHKGHDLVPVKDAANSMLMSLKTKMEDAEKSASALRRKKVSLEKDSSQQELNLKQAIISMNQTFEKMFEELKTRQRKLNTDLQQNTESVVNVLKKQREATEGSLAQIESTLDYCKQMESKSDDCEVLSAGPVLVQSLEAAAAVAQTQYVQHPTWTFSPGQMDTVIPKVHTFGEIVHIPSTETGRIGRGDFQPKHLPVAERVLEKGPHRLCGVTLTVTRQGPDTDDAGEVEIPQTTIKVSGIHHPLDVEAVALYYQNERKSGGGDIVSYRRHAKDIVYIEFKEEEVARRVVARSHFFNGRRLVVELVEPQVMCRNRALISGVPELESSEPLISYLARKANKAVSQILFGEEPGKIVVTFSDDSGDLDFAEFKRQLAKEPFCRGWRKFVLQITPVPQTRSVTVHDIPHDIPEDTVCLYFENKRRSGGGHLEDFIIRRQEGYAVLTFTDAKVAEAVCQREHVFYKARLSVHLSFDELGKKGGCFENPVMKTRDKR